MVHHLSDPDAALRELHLVLHPGGTGCVMVYNRDSVWFHLWVAYERMLVEGEFAGASVEEAFRRSTDGEDARSRAASRRGVRGDVRAEGSAPSTRVAISRVTSWSG